MGKELLRLKGPFQRVCVVKWLNTQFGGKEGEGEEMMTCSCFGPRTGGIGMS